MNLDEAIAFTLERLQVGEVAEYGYDLYPMRVARAASQQQQQDQREWERTAHELAPIFMDAAWELCRRGFVRPGVRDGRGQAVDQGGYSVTVAGAAALEELDTTAILIAQPGSLAETFAGYRQRYGAGFHQRAQEAIKCRNSEAWLACCAMAGAAAESVLLSLAVAKVEDEADVLKMYGRAGGRQKVLNSIVGTAKPHVRVTLTTFANIISLWRDEAAHGQESLIGAANADEVLRQLLEMCQWVEREWETLTT